MGESESDLEVPDFFRKPKQANLQFFILMFLQNNPTHGYELIKMIESRTFGEWRPSNSAIYNLLNLLTEKGYIELDRSGERDKKIYKLTEKGQELTNIYYDKVVKLFQAMFRTLIDDENFITPLPAIQFSLNERGKSILNGFSKQDRRKILLKFKETLKTKLKEVEKELDDLKL